MRQTFLILALSLVAVAAATAAKAEDAPCPNNRRSGPFGAVVSIEVDGKLVGTGVAVGPEMIVGLVPGSIRQAKPESIAVGWFQVPKKKPVTLLGYDVALGLAVFKPDEPMKSCAPLAGTAADERKWLVGVYGPIAPKDPGFTLIAKAADSVSGAPGPDLLVELGCKKDCTDRFIGGALMSVRTGRTVGVVVREAGKGRAYVARATFLAERIKALFAPPLPANPPSDTVGPPYSDATEGIIETR